MLLHFTTRFLHETDEQALIWPNTRPPVHGCLVESVFRHLALLKPHPQLGRVVPEFGDETVRELLFRQYRLINRVVSESGIDVLALQTGLHLLQLPL